MKKKYKAEIVDVLSLSILSILEMTSFSEDFGTQRTYAQCL